MPLKVLLNSVLAPFLPILVTDEADDRGGETALRVDAPRFLKEIKTGDTESAQAPGRFLAKFSRQNFIGIVALAEFCGDG